MTKEQALEKLRKTRILSTDLLKPLGVSMGNFLILGQITKKQSEQAIDGLIVNISFKLQQQKEREVKRQRRDDSRM